MNPDRTFDVAVIGAGMVGAAAACLLARYGLRVALVEGRVHEAPDSQGDYDLRVSAVSPGSEAILTEAGAWRAISTGRHCPYRRMRVEDADSGTSLNFAAPSFGLDHLGTIVENWRIQSALWDILVDSPCVDLFCPDELESFTASEGVVRIQLRTDGEIRARLLIGADGPQSLVRRLAGIGQDAWEYNQAGLVCVVRKQEPNPGIAWQRFMPGGPLAFLPLTDGRSSIVWTRPAAEADRLLRQGDDEFITELAAASEGWLGAVERIGPRAAFPLAMGLSHQHVAGRVVLLGDSAHAIHPLAGQGVNLGLADAAALLETLASNHAAGRDLAEPASLRAYARWRRSESRIMSLGVHGLGGLFGLGALGPARRLGLGLVSRSWIMQEAFLRRAAGLNRNAPQLSRGVPLHSLAAR